VLLQPRESRWALAAGHPVRQLQQQVPLRMLLLSVLLRLSHQEGSTGAALPQSGLRLPRQARVLLLAPAVQRTAQLLQGQEGQIEGQHQQPLQEGIEKCSSLLDSTLHF